MKPATTSSYSQKITIAILILVPFLLFFKTLSYEFSPLDEQWLIIRKFQYLNNWGNLWRAFTDPVADMYYRPLLTLSFMIDAHLGGLKPFMYHFSNLAMHIGCVLVLYRLLLLFKPGTNAALFFSLLFAVHPALTHAVVWVPGRNDIMLCLFALLSFLFLVRYTQDAKRSYLLLHLAFFAAALLSKETAVVLPFMYLAILYYLWPLSRRYFLPLLCWLVLTLTWYFVKQTVLTATIIPGNKDFFSILANMDPAFLIYIGKLIWPIHASITPTVKNSSLLAGAVTLLLLIAAAFFPGLKDKKLAGLGLLIFFGGLALPVFFGASGILGEHYEHRIYFPFAGFILFASQLNINFEARLVKPLFSLIIVVLCVKTFSRFETYSSELNYVNEGVQDCPENYVFHFLKGNVLYNSKQFSEALPCFNEAIRLQPNRIQPLTNRANTYAELDEKELAIADLDAAERLGANPHIFLNKTIIYSRYSDYPNALINFRILAQYGDKYLALLPLETLQLLTEMNNKQGGTQNVQKLNDAIAADPANAAVHLAEQTYKDLEDLNKSIDAEPRNAALYIYRAKTLVELRRWKDALADLKKACELEPANAQYKEFYNALNNSLPH